MAAAIVAVAGFAVFYVAASGAVIAGSTFEGNDGNMVVGGNANPPGNGTKDWAGGIPVTSVPDGSGKTDDTIGGSKEDDPFPLIVSQSAPPKDDYTSVHVASEIIGGHVFLYQASIRSAPNGSANENVELNQSTTLSANGVTPVRSQGDKLITFDFGGGTANVTILNWNTTNSTPCTDSNDSQPCWDTQTPLSPTLAEGAVNDGNDGRAGAITAANNPLTGAALAINQFQEMSVDLTGTGILPASSVGCETFASASIKSRSSGANGTFNSDLKDIVLVRKALSNCGTIQLFKQWVGTPGSATLQIGTTAGTSNVAQATATANGDHTAAMTEPAGDYFLSESGALSNYTPSLACFNDANGNGTKDNGESDVAISNSSVHLNDGDHVICTFTNARNPHLTLVKQVTNNNGGTATASLWTLAASSGQDPNNFSGSGPSQDHDVTAGVAYGLAESGGPSGYTGSAWQCNGGSQNGSSITLSAGQNVTCTITNDDNAPALHLRKTITNDNGGTALVTAWTLTATGPTSLTGSTPVDSGASFSAGTYTLAESNGPSGYTAGAWVCTGGSQNGSSITVGLGQDATCTINNNDNAPGLHLRKTVTNDNGGNALATAWTLTATGTVGSPTNLSGSTPVDSGSTFKADTYTLGESGPSGYTAGAWVCTGGSQNGSSITVGVGQDVTCTINNNDTAPALHLRKAIVNDNGGAALATAWTLTATGANQSPTSLSGSTPVDSGPTFKADTYALAESGPSGYTASTWSCVVTGTQTPVTVTSAHVTVGLAQDVTCTITNDDNAPALHLRKTITNDNGGTALVTAWTLTATGPTSLTGSTPVDSGASFDAGTYTLAESGPSGYTAGAWVCVGGNQNGSSITVVLGESVTCTINNDDNAPSLHLRKTITNDNGGTAAATDWTLHADGTGNAPSNLSGQTPVDSGASFNADTYALSESGGPSGYTAGTWSCVAGETPVTVTNAHVTIGLGQNVTCTIVNNDDAPSLHLRKTVTNDNGGTAAATDWTLTATGSGQSPTNLSGTTPVNSTPSFKADTYALAETGGPSDYTASNWNCVLTGTDTTVPVTEASVTVGLGQSVTCTIVNNDNGPALHLIKTVTNDDGGTALPTAWTLTATKSGAQSPALSGSSPVDSGPSFTAGTYALAESDGPSDYTASNWTCTLTDSETTVPVTEGSVTVGLGQDVTCTIANDDDAPTVTVEKRVLPSTDTGRFKFTLTQGESQAVLDNGSDGYGNGDSTGQVDVHTGNLGIVESGNGSTDGSLYSSSWSCSSNRERSAAGAGTSISLQGLQLGEHVTCTFTNTKLATLVVRKVVDNSNGGGSKGPGDFSLHVTTGGLEVPGSPAAGSATGTSYTLLPGTYKVSEGAVSGYNLTKIEGCLADGSVTLEAGQTATCTLTNTSNAPPPPPPPPPPAPKIDLQITKSAAPNPANVGNQVTWTMVVTNNGPNAATGVTMADPVPAGLTFVSATSSQGTCTGGALVSCTIGNMNVGSSVTITLVTTAATTGTISNTATTVGKEQETNTANNSATAQVVVNGVFTPPAVTYCTAVSVTPKQLFAGRKNTLTMKLTSHGKAKAGVKVKIKGSTISLTTKGSNSKGIVKQTVKPMKAGIVVFQPVATKSCKNPRVGVIGVFTPPVTG